LRRVGSAELLLHGGKAPPWLVARMERMAGALLVTIAEEYGSGEILARVSDPVWFQALSCALGYDWDSSGTTTVVCGVLKTALNKLYLGVRACGGKGRRSHEALAELASEGRALSLGADEVARLQYSSRMAAKVDNAAIQAGYMLYHHTIFVSSEAEWAVVQQGMNPEQRLARRYHWLSSGLRSFVVEPHRGIVGDRAHLNVLDMTAAQSEASRKTSAALCSEGVPRLQRVYQSIRVAAQESLLRWAEARAANPEYVTRYAVKPREMNWEALRKLYEAQPQDYEQVLAQEGIGPATVKGLALISELIYGDEPSWRDPVRYSFAFGGKDGVPFPVRRKEYDRAIAYLEAAIESSRLGERDRLNALRRLKAYTMRLG